jgi:hypothetical protein
MSRKPVLVLNFFGILIFLLLASCNSQLEIQTTTSQNRPVSTEIIKKPSIDLPKTARKTGGDLTRATDLLGPLYVSKGEYIVELKKRPWNGYWLRYGDHYLFRDEFSPLQKYDRYIKNRMGIDSNAAEAERKNIYYLEGQIWSGRCDAWAMASILEPEPLLQQPIEVGGVTFTSSDLKALLILTYEEMDGSTQFGDRFDGDYFTNTIEDIYPDQFHKVLQTYLFDQKRPVLMDKDPSPEVWNVPIYKAWVKIRGDRDSPYLLHVAAKIVAEQPAFTLEEEQHMLRSGLIKDYTYDLYGYPEPNGSFKIEYGIWTKDSVKDHPDFMWVLPEETSSHHSRNEQLNTQWVKDLIQEAMLKAGSLVEVLSQL